MESGTHGVQFLTRALWRVWLQKWACHIHLKLQTFWPGIKIFSVPRAFILSTAWVLMKFINSQNIGFDISSYFEKFNIEKVCSLKSPYLDTKMFFENCFYTLVRALGSKKILIFDFLPYLLPTLYKMQGHSSSKY